MSKKKERPLWMVLIAIVGWLGAAVIVLLAYELYQTAGWMNR